MLYLNNLGFSYSRKARPALSGLTATISPGVHLLAGQNGAGKTTLLHVIAGLITPSQGMAEIDGVATYADCPDLKQRIFLLEENMYFPCKSINDFAEIHAPFYPNFSEAQFIDNLRAFGLTGNEPMQSLSLGNRKKTQLAYVLALNVDYLLLDEPTNALDIQSKEILKKLIASSLRDEQTLIISTHTVAELENLYDSAIILDQGAILYAGSESDVTEKLSFEVTRTTDDEAIYAEVQVGRVLNIFEATAQDVPTRIDWRLLYSALHSPQRDKILQLLAAESPEQSDDTAKQKLCNPRFSWGRCAMFSNFFLKQLRRQIWLYLGASFVCASLLLLPVNEVVQTGLFTLVWTIIPFMAYFGPGIFAKGGDQRIIDRMIPAKAIEKYIFYIAYIMLLLPTVSFLLPLTACYIYEVIPAIQTEACLELIKIKIWSQGGFIAALNLFSGILMIFICFYTVMRARSNRLIKGIVSVFVINFVVGLMGAFWGIYAAFNAGLADGMAGKCADPDAPDRIVKDAILSINEFNWYSVTCVSLLALFCAIMIWRSYTLTKKQNL